MTRPLLTRQLVRPDFCQLSGEDGNALAFLAHGGHGCISVTANVAPALCAAMQDAWHAATRAGAGASRSGSIRCTDALFLETSPAPAKYALARLGKCRAELRLPLVEIGEAHCPRGRRGHWSRPGCSSRLDRPRPSAGAPRMNERLKARRSIAQNRRAFHDYAIEDRLEAGLVLTGTEVKSLREGRATINEAHAGEMQGELWLFNANIPEYHGGNRFNHEPKRPRKLLLKQREISRLAGCRQAQGHDGGAALALFLAARLRQGRDRPRPRQEGLRQAPDAKGPRLAAREAAADAAQRPRRLSLEGQRVAAVEPLSRLRNLNALRR